MSFQLISSYFTESPNHAEATFGTVSCSAGIPQDLESVLNTLSRRWKDCPACSAQRHFCYTYADKYHLLSVIEKTQAAHCAVHHLALTEDEVQALKASNSRPTPAGLIAALISIDFWQTASHSPHSVAQGEPKLTASHLPPAHQQQTWKLLTGHKANATKLLSPPYQGQCLLCVPAHFSTDHLLHLLHESSWLSVSRGWGRTFRTFAAQAPDTADIYCACIGSLQEEEFRQASPDIPVLTISPALMQAPQPTEEDVSSVVPVAAPDYLLSQKAAHAASYTDAAEPYKYIEAPDYETFDISPPALYSVRRCMYYAIGLCLLAVFIYVIVNAEIADSASGKQMPRSEAVRDAAANFAEIIRKGKTAEAELLKLKNSISNSPLQQHAVLRDCIDLLVTEAYKTAGHADNLLYLLTHSDILGLSTVELCHYYLMLATANYPADEWINNNTADSVLHGWSVLFHKYPELKNTLTHHKKYKALMLPIINAVSHH